MDGAAPPVLNNPAMTDAYAFLPCAHDLVEGVWALESPAADGVEQIAPDGCCEIIFHIGSPPLERQDVTRRRQPKAFLYGPLTRALELERAGPLSIRAIRLKPAAPGVLSARPADWRDRTVSLADVLPDEAARARLEGALKSELPDFLLQARTALDSAAHRPACFASVSTAIETIGCDPGVTLDALAASLACSRRTLSRWFDRCTGMKAGEFIRIARYHKARAAIRAGEGGLADIALAAGYADQAHMSREFRRLSGRPPRLSRDAAMADAFYDTSADGDVSRRAGGD